MIGIFITLKIIVPINKIVQEIQDANLPLNNQEKVKNKDGYFTTFTTIENHKKTAQNQDFELLLSCRFLNCHFRANLIE